jgi:hypothetical protein
VQLHLPHEGEEDYQRQRMGRRAAVDEVCLRARAGRKNVEGRISQFRPFIQGLREQGIGASAESRD